MPRDTNGKGEDKAGLAGRRYVVRGRVQGVGFRWWTQREACALHLTGTVFNRPDGAVEITAQGSARALSHLESRLVEGPPAARVDELERLPLNPRLVSPHEGFEIVRSQ